jgi:hypothetical protein
MQQYAPKVVVNSLFVSKWMLVYVIGIIGILGVKTNISYIQKYVQSQCSAVPAIL